MIDVDDNNKAYYYHFDGLGSVVALSNSNGDSCQSYEYSAYGQVAASDPNHPNPYMFTGRRFDIETGLYYYRARYYKPHIGRFMQTDPVGDGMNWYGYCGNNPLIMVDPSGCHEMAYHHFHFTMPSDLIDTTGLSLDKIPGEFSDWLLSDMAIVEQMPGWDIDSVTWVPDSDEFLDVAIFYNGCYVDDPLPVDEPELAIETVGRVQVLTVGGIGMLDDYTLLKIMEPWFDDKLAEERWVGGIFGWFNAMNGSVATPFRKDIISQWKYKSEIYDYSEVNYVGWGFAGAHYISAFHSWQTQQLIIKYLVPFYNRFYKHYGHWGIDDQFWFIKGYNLYPWPGPPLNR
ncbi:MAG: RHS repeat-associated core domain-containing protein [Phycisphaerae bacterium]